MPWYAVHTRSRHEDLVCLGLTQKAYHAFLPKLEVWSKRKDRRKKILIPMFPGYLFVELLSLENEVKVDVLKTFGVVRILGKPRGCGTDCDTRRQDRRHPADCPFEGGGTAVPVSESR